MREKKDLRLFFALRPEQKVRDQIAEFLNSFPAAGGRVVPSYNWHMTLHFIGNTTIDKKNCLDRDIRQL